MRKVYILPIVITLLPMVINNAQISILKLFLSDPAQEYNIRGISTKTRVNYRLIYKEIMDLNKRSIINLRKIGKSSVCKIDLSQNIALFSYIESLRLDDFQKRGPKAKVILNELNKIDLIYYTAIIFGSYAQGKEKNNSDLDLLFIIPAGYNAEKAEQQISSRLGLLSYRLDINVITEDSFREMKGQNKLNLVNEVVKNHIILAGAEQYYRLLIQ